MSNKKLIIIMIFIISSTFFLGIGYAQISNVNLNITGSSTLAGQTGLMITNAVYSGDQNAHTGNSQINYYYQTDLNSVIALSTIDANSYISYQVTIYNSTNSVYYYDDIVYDSNNYSNPNIIAETDSSLVHGQALAAGGYVTFNLTFKYSPSYISSASTPYNNSLSSFINFHFTDVAPVSYHNITYIGFPANSYPTTIVDNGSETITFDSPAPALISVSGSCNYTYSNGVLTITNATSDITIENLPSYDFPVPNNNGQPVELHAPGISSTSTIRVTDLLNETFTGKNLSSSVINQVDVSLTYTSSSGSAQSINIVLTVNGQNYSQLINFQGKKTNTTVTVSLTGLSIPTGTDFTVSSTRGNITNGNIQISDEKLTFYFT